MKGILDYQESNKLVSEGNADGAYQNKLVCYNLYWRQL